MARRTKKQQKAIDELLSFLFIAGGFVLYYLTKSIYLTVIIIGLCFVGLMIFIMLRNAKRNERLRLSANEAWVVTNNNYTNAAISLAKSTNVKLINRDELIELSLSVKKQQAK